MTSLLDFKRYRKPFKGADFKFIRTDGKRHYTVYASRPTTRVGWHQWGAKREVLSQNVADLEKVLAEGH